ncbi:hypothetical protein BC827DRAFT_1265206 [Russula dissimulans]|nr:hypothetical protein BC827DRAFT_1265206 [Russula dissimulans]
MLPRLGSVRLGSARLGSATSGIAVTFKAANVNVAISSEIVDVFQDDQPILVDGDLIEAAKENIQPLASGRRATALSAVLSTPHAQRKSKLAAAQNRLRINVEIALEDDDDNPLEAYCSRLWEPGYRERYY